jgi:hypothetical protein
MIRANKVRVLLKSGRDVVLVAHPEYFLIVKDGVWNLEIDTMHESRWFPPRVSLASFLQSEIIGWMTE